jgi:hypothetical protein
MRVGRLGGTSEAGLKIAKLCKHFARENGGGMLQTKNTKKLQLYLHSLKVL